ncbi:MmgE/PrpD family protein [Chelatococcus asaccharovorans]|uniref:MmgE/PrpD family protein n=1 Tax=Chelatococcus asaccharovorans TaxID=28210 RepID=UPI00224C684C|nr:MmgE/PrpD family protein [Chelatococcus asaccharovorans]CAH1663426.1 2-methylcitrate dehydratase PrpD [Chelatococcus asaccharovorans]CAH1682800.1 2-methylcitrate dehydratase PrpD [Chelatococcus asaccharovorans]
MNATQRLGAFLARHADSALAPPVASKAAICLIDALGLAIVARDEPTAAAARALATPVGEGAGTARIWADGSRAALAEAVLANGVAVHAHFQDDTEHESWSHPGSLVPPVSIALGEALGQSLADVLRATVAGYATMKWLGAGEIVARALIGRGIRTSPTLGTIGAAAAAAVALRLDAAKAASAVAIAANTTGGTLEPVRCGSDEWRVQNGRAAQGGLTAARLAAQGVVGAPDALEGAKGFLRALAGLTETPPHWARDPDPAMMAEVNAKPFATLGDNMAAVIAARVVHRDGIDLAQARRITVRIWRPYSEYPGTSFKGPFERTVQTQASTAFAVAAMLVYGELDYAMGVNNRRDPRILALIETITVVPDDEGGPMDATVAVELADGRVHQRSAADSTETLIFQDEPRATDVFEQRLVGAGRPAGLGQALAADIFASVRDGGGMPIRTVIDRLQSGAKGEHA